MTTPASTPTPEDILRAAADYMDEHGKCEGTAEDSQGRVCAIGALSNADRLLGLTNNSHVSVYDYAYAKLAKALRKRKLPAIPIWSDSNDETTVVTFLRDLSKTPEES